ncbi:MAG TPA: TetR/AcrR family transcriptional regulator [Micromonosporaceae bacterium]|nr:TetR/AcrR family transcriptional regulator [Micromonosporaceae bacterium]
MPPVTEYASEIAPKRRRSRSERQLEASAENRSAILRSAMVVFARHGYAKTTLQAVAERVGLTRTGVLHHFGSKEALFKEAIQQARRWAERQGPDTGTGGGLDGLRAMRNFVDAPRDDVHVKFVQTLQAEALYEDASEHVVAHVRMRLTEIRAYVSRCLQEAARDGEIGEVDLEALATMIAGTVNGLQVQWLLDSSVNTGVAIDALVDLLSKTAPTRPPEAPSASSPARHDNQTLSSPD